MKMRDLPKYLAVLAVLAFALSHSCKSQDNTPKIKTLVFQPGSTTPDAALQGGAKGDPSVDQIVGNFFALLEKNQIDQAYDQLTKGTPIADKPDDVATLRAKTRDAVDLFGAVQGYEQIVVKNVGAHLMCATYISLGKSYPLRWKFYFYKSDRTWRLIDIRVDDRLVEMFDESPHP